MDRIGKQKQIGLPVRREVGNDLFRRHPDPFVFQPSVPAIFGIAFVAGFDLKSGFDGIGDAATRQRFGVDIAVRREMIIGFL